MAINLDHLTEQIQVTDEATNASLTVQPKGTGAFNIAAGNSGVNVSNGGTVTAITRTGGGTYTGFVTATISAPTTAGGTTATATTYTGSSAATVASGGTGYTLNDVISVVGGTGLTTQTFTVTGVSAGVVTAVTIATFGRYTVLPSNPVSVTGGTGSGATLNLINYTLTDIGVATAGSGYVEQPTITFSGGTGSGAAAYATVGGTATVRGLGTNLDFFGAGGRGARINTGFYSGALTDWVTFVPSTFGGPTILGDNGSGGNVGLRLSSSGTSPIDVFTNGTGQRQFSVSHTASAVNYVQVTGAATGNATTISTQGSDSSITSNYSSKGPFSQHIFLINGYTSFQVAASNGVVVNRLSAQASLTGFGPVLSAQGSDTNIPLVLQPKGTGALQAQQTDSTATGGNARGAYAVDWQTGRTGASQVASGQYNVIGGGFANTASAFNSTVAGGNGNVGAGSYCFIGGGLANSTSGQAYSSAVGGQSNTSAGYYNFVGGGFTNSATSSSAVTTQSGTMNGTTAVTLSGSNASIKVGQYITGTSIAGDTYVAAISGTSLTLSKNASGSSTSTLSFLTPHGVVVGGGNNQATGSYSFIGGGGDAGTAANRNVASGDWSVVVGGIKNTSSGSASVVVGGGSFGSGFAANTASGTSSFIGAGYLNNASGFASVIGGGSGNTTNNNSAFVGGGNANIANSDSGSIAGGQYGTTRSINGNAVFPAHVNPIAQSAGVSQAALLILGVQTTDATATVLRSSTAAAGTINQVILPNNSAYYFRGTVVAGVTGGGNTKGWTIEGVIKRGANAASTTLVGSTVMSSYADVGAATWTIALSADTTNGGLAVTFTGQAATTIRAVCSINTTEMTY